MKKFLKVFSLVTIFLIVLTGCGIKNADNVLNKLKKKIENSKSYYIEGEMQILNNEDTYNYDVKVSYKKGDFYKVELVNTLNNHEQVILRNEEGVYVVTPSLNKSFKFQSDWPYNNSQIYLLSSIIEDLSEDEDRKFEAKNNSYYFQSSVNYPNNKSLTKQNVYVDKNNKITKAEVTNDKGKVQITMDFEKIEYNKKFDEDYFELSRLIDMKNTTGKNSSNTVTNNPSNTDSQSNQNATKNSDTTSNDTSDNPVQNSEENNNSTSNNTNSTNHSNNEINNTTTNENANDNNTDNDNNQQTKTTATIDDVIYPMYLPTNTTLTSKETIDTESGQRLILTFEGDNPFVLVEETVSYADEGLIIPVSGSLDFLTDVIGVINDNSVSFDSNGVGYYIVSDTLETSELVAIARSISVLPVSK